MLGGRLRVAQAKLPGKGSQVSQRKRIVILGGGIGALTTAWQLSSADGWRERYDITVYQLGWRLGGKCASSRNPEHGLRIEEHGLHVWFGFYENAFRMMRECYRELGRPQDSLLAGVETSLSPQTLVSMLEQPAEGGGPAGSLWTVPFRQALIPGAPGTDQGLPGAGADAHAMDLWDIPQRLLGQLLGLFEDPQLAEHKAGPVGALLRDARHQVDEHVRKQAQEHENGQQQGPLQRLAIDALIVELRLLRTTLHGCLGVAGLVSPLLRRVGLMADLGLSVIIGMLRDNLFQRGLSSIDHLDLREWLRLHGAAEDTVGSVLLRALYDCCFAYRDGDTARPDFAAGAALGCALRIALMWRGSVFYLMNAGMGDVVIAPLYEALRARGVQFEFFHRAKHLELDQLRRRVARVRFGRQATVRPECQPYDPLLRPADLPYPVWPHLPRLEQLEEGAALQGVDLESHWSPWPDVAEWTLELEPGDRLVLGISLGGLPPLCAELAAADPAWKELLEQLPTIQTQAVQLWFGRSEAEMGWANPDYAEDTRPVMVAAPELLDVWADMRQCLEQERWPGTPPRCVQYFCGPLPGDLLRQRAATDAAVPDEALAEVRAEAQRWFGSYTRMIWPGSAEPGAPGLDWSLLHHAGAAQGPARLDGQYLRANIDPTERYVLSPKRFNHLRLAPDRSGFDNLVLAGDWTRTSINAGCVEAAVMSGMSASRALCGYPQRIHGEHFLQGTSGDVPPIKVAVLGSGCGAMSAAYWLSSTEELRRRYQVTIYTPGWRLGGKGASGRAQYDSIREHGLHLMMGFYETVFQVVRDCHQAMDKPPRPAFKDWRDAFEEQYRITLWRRPPGEAEGATPSAWNLDFPSRPGVPGDGPPRIGPELDSVPQLAHRLLGWLVGESQAAQADGPPEPAMTKSPLRRMIAHLLGGAPEPAPGDAAQDPGERGVLARLAQHAARPPEQFGEEHWRSLHADLCLFHDWLHRKDAPALSGGLLGRGLFDSDWRHDLVLVNLSVAGLRGLLVDVLPHGLDGFARIDHLDFKDWLQQHGAWPDAATDPLVMCLYDLAFAYAGGDSSSPAKGQAAAGAMLRLILRMAFTYKGAPLWKMRAGMGDVIFTPLYRTLLQRGVRFEFFRRANELHLAADGRSLTGIDLQRQAQPKDGTYRPLVRVAEADGGNAWDCWPAQPLWEQLVDGAGLQQQQVDFEDPWTLSQGPTQRLELGRDFDAVVLGIPPPAAAPITQQLSRANPAWAAMLANSSAVATLSVQLWLKPALRPLGWKYGVTVSTTFADPLRSWGEMSQVLPAEHWPAELAPKSCEYLCGTYMPPAAPPAGTSTPDYIPAQNREAERIGRAWLASHAGALWPNACDAAGALDWNKVAGVYWRANVADSELYVQSPPGTIQYRLDPGRSGFDNLFLAGDWTRTSLNGGCAEAAFESGLLAARALMQKVIG
jgi:uncharacterized protein with NAD-binding domain and iron-sulfur cluster